MGEDIERSETRLFSATGGAAKQGVRKRSGGSSASTEGRAASRGAVAEVSQQPAEHAAEALEKEEGKPAEMTEKVEETIAAQAETTAEEEGEEEKPTALTTESEGSAQQCGCWGA